MAAASRAGGSHGAPRPAPRPARLIRGRTRRAGVGVGVVVIVVAIGLVAGCKDKAAEAKKRADTQKAFMEAEAKAQAEADAKEAKAAFDGANSGCNGGDGNKCVELGRIFHEGKGQPKDAKQAVQAFAKACALKVRDGCRNAAATEPDDKRKLDYIVMLCDLGDVDGCIDGAKVGDALIANHVLPEPKKPQDRLAMVLLKKACAFGQVMACTARGVGLANDDPPGAVDSFTKGCDGGEPTSCKLLGDLLKEGKGVKKKDEKKAKEMYKKACQAGLKEAC